MRTLILVACLALLPLYELHAEGINCAQNCCGGTASQQVAWTPWPAAGDIAVAYDHFRSLPDGSFTGNTGAFTKMNLGLVPPLCCGIGVQVGGSYGLYDWAGRGSVDNGNQNEVQQQYFVTAGIYRKTPCRYGINFGVVYDWMGNENFSVFGISSNFDQVRFQAGYLFCGSDELGFWGTARLSTSDRDFFGLPVRFRSLDQINLFWRHTYCNRAWTQVWLGAPYSTGLMFEPGKDGNFLIGGSFSAPLYCNVSVDGHAMYMVPRSGSPALQSRNDAVNICLGLKYSFGYWDECGTQRQTVGPYLPVADNSTFISDTDVNF